MITIIQGTPGSGKSAVCVVDMLEFLQYGGVVACNFDLVPGWQFKLAATVPRVRWGLLNRDKVARGYWDRAFKVGTHDTVFELSQQLRDLTGTPKGARMKEGVGRLYLDEAQFLFNTRDWRNNQGYIEFFTQHRKLGWDVYLIAHSRDMIDKQILPLIEYETRLRNLQKVKFLGVLPVSPYPAFFAITRYAGISAGAGEIQKRRLYLLRPQYASLYDSMEVFAFDAASRSISKQGSPSLEAKPKKVTAPAPASSWPQYHTRIDHARP